MSQKGYEDIEENVHAFLKKFLCGYEHEEEQKMTPIYVTHFPL